MACDLVREWLTAELDGEATADEQGSALRHLAGCPACREARAAAAALRSEFRRADWAAAADPHRVDALIALLRREGRVRPLRPVGGLLQRLGGLPGGWSLQPGAAMAAAFLLTWGALSMAESGRLPAATRRVVASARTAPAASLGQAPEWLRRAATLARLLQAEKPWPAERDGRPVSRQEPGRRPPDRRGSLSRRERIIG